MGPVITECSLAFSPIESERTLSKRNIADQGLNTGHLYFHVRS